MTQKTFLLVFVKDGKASVVLQRDSAVAIQRERTKLKSDPKYRGGELQLRTKKGFENKKVL